MKRKPCGPDLSLDMASRPRRNAAAYPRIQG